MTQPKAPENTYDKAWQYAERFLTQQPRTSGQVRRKLRLRHYSEEIITEVVAKLKETGFLDDRKYAIDYINYSVTFRPMGRARLRQKLIQRLIVAEIITETLQVHFTEEQERVALQNAYEKKSTQLKSEPNPQKRREKIGRYLANRGFSTGLILEKLND